MDKTLTLCAMILLLSPAVFAQQVGFKAKVIDRENNSFQLAEIKRHRYEYFNCRIRDRIFRLDFNRIQSIDFIGKPDDSISGYTLANLKLTGGESTNIYISSSSDSLQGSDQNLNILIRIPISDIQSINFIE